jgi:dihydrofolate reductase
VRPIRIIEHISLDGVIQAPGAPGEDGDYPYGGWIVPFSDPTVGEVIMAAHAQPFDLLLGRRTYDIWAAYWPKVHGNVFADSFNAATKYVATHRPESLQWGPVEGLGVDIVERLRRLKAEDAGKGNIILWGSSTLAPVVLAHGLVDEVVLLVYPVLLGSGKRFFSEGNGVSARELALVSTKTASSDVLINTYRPVGPLRTGSFPDPPG